MKKILTWSLVLSLAIVLAGYVYKKSDSDSETGTDATDYYARLEHCAEQIRQKTDFVPDIALVLGSGLGDFADNLDITAEIPYSEIDGFPVSTVEGHDGRLIFCTLGGKKLAVMKGRVHYYEGYNMHEVVLPLRVLHMLGAKTAVLTNAIGAINKDFNVGDFVLTTDHISSFVPSPLVGENIEKLGGRFVDMSKVYDEEMISIVESIAAKNNIPVHRGVLVQTSGPQYETPTEIRMYRNAGADTVGMSTVVESIAAKHMGMRVCNISCITNMAAGLQAEISHDEVQSSSDSSSKSFSTLVSGLISELR